jgi:hypothetical protein
MVRVRRLTFREYYINITATDPILAIFGWEITHWLITAKNADIHNVGAMDSTGMYLKGAEPDVKRDRRRGGALSS